MKSRTDVELMRELEPLRVLPTLAFEAPTPKPREASNRQVYVASKRKTRNRTIWQFMQFGLVGCVNTNIDLLVLNGLLWLWPGQNIARLLLFNTLAYTFGALNSFVFNRYWTFQREGPPNAREGARFLLVTLTAIACNDLILWLMSTILHPVHLTPTLWTNVSKVVAIGSTILLSYLGMRLWVFVQSSHEKLRVFGASVQRDGKSSLPESTPISSSQQTTVGSSFTTHSLSVVLPAYNEEQVIASTVEQVTHELANLTRDFEVIVVNDGSTDGTGAALSALQKLDKHVRVLTHTRNQGYGATLADGFAAATKVLTFFMDSDGQFDIRELKRFLCLIDAYDAVIGYRVKRQDTWMRKLNAWGWKLVVRLALGVRVRDIDCAFKLLRTDFLQRHPLETRGAMINAELLYRLKVSGCTLREVGVRHLPRRGGRATGANLHVIGRAFRELFVSTRTWRHEELASQTASDHGFFKGNTGALIHTDHIGVTTFFPARIQAAAIDALRDRAEEMT
jgi:putative flippase GtrA